MSDEDNDEFDTSEAFDLEAWLGTFSYEKAHAIYYGFLFAFIAAVAASAYVLAIGIGILMWAMGIRASPYRETKTGDKCDASEDERDPRKQGLTKQLLMEIRHKPHYYVGGLIVGDRAGYATHWFLTGAAPDHYRHLPEMLELFVPMILILF